MKAFKRYPPSTYCQKGKRGSVKYLSQYLEYQLYLTVIAIRNKFGQVRVRNRGSISYLY